VNTIYISSYIFHAYTKSISKKIHDKNETSLCALRRFHNSIKFQQDPHRNRKCDIHTSTFRRFHNSIVLQIHTRHSTGAPSFVCPPRVRSDIHFFVRRHTDKQDLKIKNAVATTCTALLASVPQISCVSNSVPTFISIIVNVLFKSFRTLSAVNVFSQTVKAKNLKISNRRNVLLCTAT
jgi:hypothetical protein